jgi:LCP family protein required for cell wall assembly
MIEKLPGSFRSRGCAVPVNEQVDDQASVPARGGRPIRRFLLVLGVFAALVVVFVCCVAAVAWHAVHERNAAVPKDAQRALTEPKQSARSSARVVLLIGSDTSKVREEQMPSRMSTADSMMLLRIDPKQHSINRLSIPRDLLVSMPDHGPDKVGAAYAIGGLALAINTVEDELDVKINHVVLVNFDGFRRVIDSLGGVTVDNPYAIESAVPFDGRHWRFREGRIHLDGHAALAYARLRKVDGRTIAANPDEGQEPGRSIRQQRVIDAMLEKLTVRRFLTHPFSLPQDVMRPVTTDIDAKTLVDWGVSGVAAAAADGMRCRLGGTIVPRAGDEVIMPAPLNERVVSAFLGRGSVPPPLGPTDGGCWAASASR